MPSELESSIALIGKDKVACDNLLITDYQALVLRMIRDHAKTHMTTGNCTIPLPKFRLDSISNIFSHEVVEDLVGHN